MAPGAASRPSVAPAPVLVGTGPELLAALQQAAAAQGPGSSVVELTRSIALTAEDAANLTLPLFVGANRTLELRGGTGALARRAGQLPCWERQHTGRRLAQPHVAGWRRRLPGRRAPPHHQSHPAPPAPACAGGGLLPTLDFGGMPELLYMAGGSHIVVQGLNITGGSPLGVEPMLWCVWCMALPLVVCCGRNGAALHWRRI